ncbi:MAG: hypothetical protein ACETVW_02545, partial [Dehalococcoidia bacterium]
TKMTMASNNKNDPFSSSSINGRMSFEEHNQRMKAFYRAHAQKLEAMGRGGTKVPKKATTPLSRQLSRKEKLNDE